MGIVRFSAIVLAVLVLVTSGIYASGFENTGIGTKARGMAGAFRGIADDWTAAYYNPAGYAYIWDNQLGANMGLLHYRHEIVPNAKWGGLYERGIYNDRTNYNAHEILSNPSAGIVFRVPLMGETVVGFSGYQRFDNNVTWTLYDPVPSYSDSVSLPDDQYRNNLDVVSFQVTMAREFIEDKLSLGIGLQLLRADLIYTNVFFRENPITNTPNDPYYDIMSDFPYDRLTEWSKNDGNGWGFGFNIGMLAKVNEKLDIGASINVPFPITISGDTENRFYMPNELNVDSAAIANPGAVGQLFISGQTVIDEAEFEADLDLPVAFGIGFAYRATERLTVALDAEYTLWSMYEGLSFAYTNHTGLTGPADTSALANDFFTADLSALVDWDNTGKVALGFAYEFPTFLSNEASMTLVGGGSWDQSPARNATQFSPQFFDTGDKLGLNLGGIVHIQQWDLGITTSYLHQPELTVDGLDMDADYELFPGVYNGDVYETILSFNYRF